MRNELDRIKIPDNLNDKVEEALAVIKKKQRQKSIRKTAAAFGGMAAVIAAFFIFCMANPVMASKLPLIGNIFQKVQDSVDYKGDFSSRAQNLQAEVSDEEAPAADPEYVQTSNGITFTVSEVYYNSKALYLAVSIENEEEFPADFMRTKNDQEYILDYDCLEMMAEGKADFLGEEGDLFPGTVIEGQFLDGHTFVGIIRVDLNLNYWPGAEEIAAAGIQMPEEDFDQLDLEEASKLADEYNLKVKAAFPDAGTPIEIPDQFSYDLNISSLGGDLNETVPEEITFPEGDTRTVQTPVKKEYQGTWNFHFDVTLDNSQTQVVEINETNEEGVGISSVEITPYEISAERIVPEGKLGYNYFTVICDAAGDLMDYQGNSVEVYQTYGRDTSKITIAVCDYLQYMDELKGYYWSPDYQEKKKEKTFAQYLQEHAVYWTEVTM